MGLSLFIGVSVNSSFPIFFIDITFVFILSAYFFDYFDNYASLIEFFCEISMEIDSEDLMKGFGIFYVDDMLFGAP